MRTNSKTFFVACGVMAACSGAAMAQIAIDDHLRRTLETPLSSSEILVGRAQFVELEEGDTKELVFAIDPAEKYTIYGACDDECSDINLVARDLNGAIVDSDEEDDDEPLVQILPGESGAKVRVTLSLEACETSHCIAGIAMFRSR